MRKIAQKPLFWIILASMLPVLSLLHPGMPFVHDGQDHVARIANFYAALKDGVIVPRWAANLNWGYGHPILMFLYPLPEYLASAFHFLGFTLVDSTKLVFGLSFIASAAAMFLWMNAAFGVEAGILGSLLYTFAPYRFVDLHVRGALGEHVAFVFPPLVLYFLFKKRWIPASISLAALILSHNAISLMFLPVIGLYALYLLIFESKKRWLLTVYCLLSIILGFGLSAFFWMPALLEGKFTLRDIVTAGEALKRFVPWTWFVYSPWNYGGTETLTKALGFPQWIGILAALILLFKSKQRKQKILISGLLLLLLVSLFIMTSASAPIWRASKLLQDFQFPWRFLSVSVFIAAVLGGIAIPSILRIVGHGTVSNKHILWMVGHGTISNKHKAGSITRMNDGQESISNKQNRRLLFTAYCPLLSVYCPVFIAYCLLSLLLTAHMWYPKGYQVHDDSFYSGVYPGTSDTGESSPVWSVRFMEHAPANPLEVIDGDATVTVGKRTSVEHEYTLIVRKPTLMMENTLYFPGWTIYVNNIPTGIEWQNQTYRGLMTFRVTPGEVHVRVVFEDTKVRSVANWISTAALLFVTIVSVGGLVWKRKK